MRYNKNVIATATLLAVALSMENHRSETENYADIMSAYSAASKDMKG